MSIFGFLVCKCSPEVPLSYNITSFQDKMPYVTTCYSKCAICITDMFVHGLWCISSSSSILVLAILIWSLVVQFIMFRVVYLTIFKAVIIILKHATLLCLSNLSPELALTQAEQEYQQANIDLKIHEHLMVSSQVQSIESSAGFVMDIIGWFILASLIIS